MERVGIVIPCFNEAARFDSEAYVRALDALPGVTLVLVNDGSTDGTLERLESLRERFPERVHVIDQQPNQGKAAAVRKGMRFAMDSDCMFAGYWDADLATPLEAVADFLELMRDHHEADLVLGARVALLGRSIQRKASRHYLGRVFATAVSHVLALPVYDTQCGAKLMRCKPELRALFDEPFASRWIFDVELIARYLQATARPAGIMELPLWRWHDIGGSKVQPVDFLRAFGELVEVHRRYRLNQAYGHWIDRLSAPFSRYSLAGASGTLVHFAVLAASVELFNVSPVRGAILGALAGAALNYVVNYHFTFASNSPHFRQFSRFCMVALVGICLSAGGVWLGTERWGLHYLAAQAIASALFLALGFALNRRWAFAANDPPAI